MDMRFLFSPFTGETTPKASEGEITPLTLPPSGVAAQRRLPRKGGEWKVVG
jgi:hypothetical protein